MAKKGDMDMKKEGGEMGPREGPREGGDRPPRDGPQLMAEMVKYIAF